MVVPARLGMMAPFCGCESTGVQRVSVYVCEPQLAILNCASTALAGTSKSLPFSRCSVKRVLPGLVRMRSSGDWLVWMLVAATDTPALQLVAPTATSCQSRISAEYG